MTLASVWSGRPEITELLIVRPVLNLPLQRVREANPPARTASSNAAGGISIEHVSVTGGTVVFSNLRDRVENRIETINADATMGSDRKLAITGNARAAERAAEIRDQGDRAARRRSSGRTFRPNSHSMRPACCRRRCPAKAEVRLNGSVVMINGLSRHARRRRLQRLGLGRCREQAAGEARSRLPAIGGRDAPGRGGVGRAAVEQCHDRPQRA